MTFLLAKDMHYFVDVLTLIRYFNKEKQEMPMALRGEVKQEREEEKEE